MYGEMEAIIDFYGWTLPQAKALSVRERRHFYERVKAMKENRPQ